MSQLDPKPDAPSNLSRRTSAFTIGFIGSLSKLFTYAFNRQQIHGLDGFLDVLEQRQDPQTRKRGLITVSNHVSIIDDPLLWAFLPFRYMIDPKNMRWSLGSYDLCYQSKLTGSFFFAGQVLPTHRLKHSPLGGPFQPTMREAIRLLSDAALPKPSAFPTNDSVELSHPAVPETDPFSAPTAPYTYSTNGADTWPSPSCFSSNRYSWIHIFPEGRVHQHPDKTMRYFRWGIARLILEADECPDIIPMWIEGYNKVFPEDRGFPRPVPRIGNDLDIWFGRNIGGEMGNPFLDLRRRWRDLVQRETAAAQKTSVLEIGTLPERLHHGSEAVNLRLECTKVVRDAVLEVRRARGLRDEDPKSGLVETWREEGSDMQATGRKDDGSLVGEE